MDWAVLGTGRCKHMGERVIQLDSPMGPGTTHPSLIEAGYVEMVHVCRIIDSGWVGKLVANVAKLFYLSNAWTVML